ncbi:fibronectin type III domain-containing protein [Actinophytocola sp.]|uniref:fibronectin type III domain-containing protein n=1 Tax=Actinophytocola sp. TaxID=1872138 RepID=UPI002EDA1565
MPTRKRLLAWLAGAVLLVTAVIVLRTTETDPSRTDAGPQPVRVDRFASDTVVLPSPGDPPAAPDRIVVTPDTEQLRLSWADGLTGGTAPEGVVGYEVRWHRDGGPVASRLVAAPDVQLDGLRNGRRYRVEVRGIDRFGQRSAPAEVIGVPARADRPWLAGLTGLYDDFGDPASTRESSPRSRWHLSGFRGCVGLGAARVGGRGLPVDLGCGADMAVLRAREPMRLTAPEGTDGVLGRIAVRTDTVGPGGELTVDLVPGRADRVGVGVVRASRTDEVDPALPGGTIRVVVADNGVRVAAAPDVRSTGRTTELHTAPRRGAGVVHLFEVVLTTSGVRVYQDGLAVAARGVVPAWRAASVLLGLHGPDGRRSRVHVSAAGFSGPPVAAPGVVEASVNAGTQQVLGLAAQEPGIGIARTPLRSARSARLVATMTVTPELDPRGVVVQLGTLRVPARPTVTAPARVQGATLTVVADVPAALLGPHGPDTLTPFVLRAPGTSPQVSLLETYLEITPTPSWAQTEPPSISRPELPDGLPVVGVVLGNAAGEPLDSTTVPRRGQLVLDVTLDAATAQWDTGAVAGVQGLQVRLDRALIAGVPTAADGPGVGGRYAVSIAVGRLAVGPHTIEVREYGTDGRERPFSALLNFVVS